MNNVQDLMKPRRKVIAGYPTSHMYFDIGDILEWDGQYYKCKKNISMTKDTVESYPHIFKELSWYEERQESEMPEYVKHIEIGRVYKVSDADEKYPDGFVINYPMTEHHVSYKRCLPATEKEYLEYINKQQ